MRNLKLFASIMYYAFKNSSRLLSIDVWRSFAAFEVIAFPANAFLFRQRYPVKKVTDFIETLVLRA